MNAPMSAAEQLALDPSPKLDALRRITDPSPQDIERAQRSVRQRKARIKAHEAMMMRKLANDTGVSLARLIAEAELRRITANPAQILALKKRINAKFHRS